MHLCLAVAVLVLGCKSLQNAIAEGDTRTISMHHLHTGESITITYKRDGRYDEAALQKLDWFLRDWREHKAIHMDPHLIDLLWEVNRDVGGTQPIQIVCGYRDEHTNSMLRRRSSGVAQYSQHVLGKAIDFFIPGVPLAKLRAAGLRLQRGGVGFYPSSGSPFVHMDVGGVRYWPHMSREQLVRIFPDGRTVHIPSDGRPLKNYALALADIERRGGRPSALSLAAAQRTGIIDHADRIAANSGKTGKRSLLASLFGFGETDAQSSSKPTVAGTAGTPARVEPPVRVAAAVAPVPLPKTRPVVIASASPPAPLPVNTVIASASAAPAEIVRERFYWVGLPEAASASRAVTLPGLDDSEAVPQRGLTLAAAETDVTGSAGEALAYAAEPLPAATGPRRSIVTRWAGAATSIVAKASPAQPRLAITAFDPWLEAVAMTPSVRRYLSATRYGRRDLRGLQPLLEKPATTLAMTFSPDRNTGPNSARFSGHAVVFVETVSFGATPLHTAWLP